MPALLHVCDDGDFEGSPIFVGIKRPWCNEWDCPKNLRGNPVRVRLGNSADVNCHPAAANAFVASRLCRPGLISRRLPRLGFGIGGYAAGQPSADGCDEKPRTAARSPRLQTRKNRSAGDKARRKMACPTIHHLV